MPDATDFGRQWAGLVALVRLVGAHASEATLVEDDGMVASVVPIAPTSSILNTAVSLDPTRPPHRLQQLAARFEQGGAAKWGLWVDGDDPNAADAAREQGMVLDSRPAPMVAVLDDLPFDDAPARIEVDLATVGRGNDLAYGYTEPKLAHAVAALPADSVRAYGAENRDSVALVHDIGTDTAVWFVATLPQSQRQGLGRDILQRLLLDARARGRRTASLQASPAGRPLYERLGFTTVGSLHLYEQRFS